MAGRGLIWVNGQTKSEEGGSVRAAMLRPRKAGLVI